MIGRILLPLALAVASGSTPARATTLGPYEIVTLGFTDAAHTRSDGYQESSPILLSDSGLATGLSSRYGGAASLGRSAWLYDSASNVTTRIGLFDAAHTRSDGYQFSYASRLDESALAAGYSFRYGGGTDLGQSAWIYDNASATTTRVGFFDAAHSRSDGYQYSFVQDLNDSGLTTGYSRRYAGGSWTGSSAWLYDNASSTTARIGFFDATHTRSDGFQETFATLFDDAGLTTGYSLRYGGGSPLGQSAWIHDSASAITTRVGFFDAVHTRNDGYQASYASLLDSGLAAGQSDRFASGFSLGRSAWVHDVAGGTTARVGLFDAAHTRSDFYQYSSPLDLDEGVVVGVSERFSGGNALGQSAWIYDSANAATTRLGFLDAVHTRSDGYQYSSAFVVKSSGLAAGYSHRFVGDSALGQSAWIYDDASDTTTRVGFLDAAHTRSDGYQYSYTFDSLVGEAGLVAGYSAHFGSASEPGRSTWIYDSADTTTRRIGVFDATHTREDGYQYGSFSNPITDTGIAAGHSLRFSGATSLGQSAWVYDGTNASQYTIVLSTRSDGYAFAQVSFLGEDGLALGAYELFDGEDNFLGLRAFAWTSVDGGVDLGALLNGGLAAAGWASLAEALSADGLGQILGRGRLASGGDLAYLLVAVPEPGTALLLELVLAGLALATWRSNADDR